MTKVIIPISMVLLVGIVGFLVFHHAFTHQGQGFDIIDFKNASSGLFSSHEGLILFVIVFITGMMIGGMVF